jgi:hypothetical protein
MLPRGITRILMTMSKQHTKPPVCNNCWGARATRKPWRGKGKRYIQRHLKKTPHPGEVVSVDQLESSIPGFIGQMTGKLTKSRDYRKVFLAQRRPAPSAHRMCFLFFSVTSVELPSEKKIPRPWAPIGHPFFGRAHWCPAPSSRPSASIPVFLSRKLSFDF